MWSEPMTAASWARPPGSEFQRRFHDHGNRQPPGHDPGHPIARPDGRIRGRAGDRYRSVADGELASAWTLQDYFALPQHRDAAAGQGAPQGRRSRRSADADRASGFRPSSFPTGLVAAAFLLALGVFVVRPLLC